MAAYAVIVRGEEILLSRIAPKITRTETWTLPGGGVEHGEDPREAVVREVYEETGLRAEIGETAHVFSAHMRNAWRRGRRVDNHAVRIVYEGWVAADSPAPHVVEVDGSTSEAAWKPLADVLSGAVPTSAVVGDAVAAYQVRRRQRAAAYGCVLDGDRVLLTRTSDLAPNPGTWHLPGGGIDHGEKPEDTVARELWEECGLTGRVDTLLTVVDHHFTGTAPDGREEDFHAIGIIYRASVDPGEPRVVEEGGTTDAVAWVPIADIESGAVPVYPLVRAALAAAGATVTG
ncbi:NUDIX domain-containing protein [Nocardioides sp. GY 10113]|nr:NUDIX domain-containing protein [Nocardioides sp. GY 10113]